MLFEKGDLAAEEYDIYVENNRKVTITASEELGFIYALIYISEHCLQILPFWFWNDQRFVKQKKYPFYLKNTIQKKPVAYRGWFINDEGLIGHWDAEKATYPVGNGV